jgi:hypothetical protein
VSRLSQDFPTIAKHLCDVVIHFLQIKQRTFPVDAEDALSICVGFYLHVLHSPPPRLCIHWLNFFAFTVPRPFVFYSPSLSFIGIWSKKE